MVRQYTCVSTSYMLVDCYKTHGSKLDREHENNFKRKYDVHIII